MKLRYVVVTSVDRDDLRDGGAAHFANCIQHLRKECPSTAVEILTPDFRARMNRALAELAIAPPDVFSHNLETIPRLYRAVRPGSDYTHSLQLLKKFGEQHPQAETKSGIMVGIGETRDEVIELMKDLREHSVSIFTIGQYLQPSRFHLPISIKPLELNLGSHMLLPVLWFGHRIELINTPLELSKNEIQPSILTSGLQ